MAHGRAQAQRATLQSGRAPSLEINGTKGTEMKNLIKSATFRALLLLSALASSGLVLEAARRWS
ncbi:MAG TPA: hypothetical protein VGQ89_03615 [Candidatus Limnocylindrales bacterium]|jgi:hypothetical protein|nr:hypothetical protein [Candidatus Limnocylindrales bacterium]